ncbi:hypothetical protein ACIRL2_45070 [Embleya sp. NPDC127516]
MFSKVLRRYVRELGAFTLLEAVNRCNYLPGSNLQDSVPAMRREGRIQVA